MAKKDIQWARTLIATVKKLGEVVDDAPDLENEWTDNSYATSLTDQILLDEGIDATVAQLTNGVTLMTNLKRSMSNDGAFIAGDYEVNINQIRRADG